MRSTRYTVVFCSLAMAALLSSQLGHSQQQQTSSTVEASQLGTIVLRMQEAQLRNRQNYRAYTVTRDYRLYGSDNDKANSEVIAEVSFVPPDQKSFNIQQVQGSKRGENIVRKVLQGESDMATKDAPAALSTSNYDFALAGEAQVNGRSCYVLQLIPKREEKTLLKGQAWVDKQTYLVHRVEGDMAKTPSWWLKNVHMTVLYAEAAGMWLPTATDAVADVRMFGRHTFVSRALEVRSGDVVAQTFSRVPPDFLAPAPAYQSVARKAINVHAVGAVRHRPAPAALIGSGIVADQ